MKTTKPKIRNTYGPVEKPHYLRAFVLWLLIILAAAGIGWMIWTVPKEKAIVCRKDAPHSLIGFGNCKEEE